ncbi:hypothetical protein [Rhodococcus sp. RCBS9]|uniref:hypothetical protein n=1 Tax=Rhodococcus sp. RCBS9 TaxID=3031999 RepID=UPI0024029916|nr:hypothetical protein [Rhodococcus sp. RCBS9]WEX03826.1 hypothetical protein P0M12_30180 [Rhodococcus sp. RCBS9]WEX03905.1 hypothetical protein P0M12_00195 [Rhodococcus sp. RCBS9]
MPQLVEAHVQEDLEAGRNPLLRWVAVDEGVALGILTASLHLFQGSGEKENEVERYACVEIIYNASDVRRIGYTLALHAKAEVQGVGQTLYRTGIATDKGESTLEEAGIELSPDARASTLYRHKPRPRLEREKAIDLGDKALQSAATELGLKVWGVL